MGDSYSIFYWVTSRRIVYKNWAGISVVGTQDWVLSPGGADHMERAAWLTATVETGAKFGTVQSYDGAGMSAGIEHKIAIYPKTMEQGGLWGLLSKLPQCDGVMDLKSDLAGVDWFVDVRGILRKKSSGAVVSGAEIRTEFTPPQGTVPETGPAYNKAVKWAKQWADAFSDPATFRTQIDEAKRGLLNSHKDVESTVYKKYAGLDDASAATTKNISADLDLAMSFYHSFSVNAPTKARKILSDVLAVTVQSKASEKTFCKLLLKALGTSTYGNWKQRYLRTRTKAKNSGLWTASLFEDIAPEKP